MLYFRSFCDLVKWFGGAVKGFRHLTKEFHGMVEAFRRAVEKVGRTEAFPGATESWRRDAKNSAKNNAKTSIAQTFSWADVNEVRRKYHAAVSAFGERRR